jgi:ABC-type multidrug transport system ATPase subunit
MDKDNKINDKESIDFLFWDRRIQKSEGSGLWFSQLKALLRKNIILTKRSWKTYLMITIITPLIIMLFLEYVIKINKDFMIKSVDHPERIPLPGVKDCIGDISTPDNCISLMFTNCIDDDECTRDSEVDKIMSTFIENNNERMNLTWSTDPNKWDVWDKDKLNYNVTKKFDIVHVPNSNFIYNYTMSHVNTTSFGIVFDINKDSGTNYRYQIWHNSTLEFNNTATISRGIDEAIIQLNSGKSDIKPRLNIDIKDFPIIGYDENYSDYIISISGGVFFFCVSMVVFINLLNNVVSDKETKVRYSMEMMGMKRSAYWTSWIIYYFVLFLINSLTTIFIGKIFGYSFFTNCNFLVLIYLFFGFGLALASLGFFISTLVNRTKTAVLIGISILIIGFFVEYIVFSSSQLCYSFWAEDSNPIYRRIGSYLIPFFNFGKMYMDVSFLSSNTYNYISETIVEGPGFKYDDLFEKVKATVPGNMNLDNMEPTINAFYYLIFNMVFYMILTIYFDNVRPNKYGKKKPFYYFLLPSYWKRSDKIVNCKEWIKETPKKYPHKIDVRELDDDVRTHFRNTCNPDYETNAPVRIINLRKEFGYGKKKKIAIKNSCLTIGKNKVIALLGQNGAGKSTTMNIISGLSTPTSGDVLVMNKSVLNNASGVQSELGICPQDDILFKDLTAMEHLKLYSGIKGAINCLALDDILINRLKAVQLYTVKDALSKTYSGGMKRRLSMIIATIGDPNVILLDEPTTGMDPVNRRYVWRFIENFKKGRCVLLTTHSMEEADALGDEIVIMSRSVVKAIGNSIHLKNKFGNGYSISIIANGDENIENVKQIAKEMVPGIRLADDSAGALIFEFSYDLSEYIPKFVQYLDENPDGIISTWGMSQTTLEEVFLTVIHEDSKRKFKEE